ncbi:MAG: ABC transporter permease [Verrucomicrobia bacterium]|nr:ABC transporter permease [Verrucomicrobiota bacterium]
MVKRLIQSEYLVLLLSAVYFAALAPFTPGFASTGNLANILSSMLPLLVVAMGQTFVLIAGGIDLSVTSTIALASVVGASVATGDQGILSGNSLATPGGILAMLLVGATVGSFNGAAITRFRMPPFIVTLTTMIFVSGFAVWLTQSKSIFNLPTTFTILGSNVWVALPLVAVATLVMHFALSRTLLGHWIYAIGHNKNAAEISGVPVRRVLLFTYIASGLCAAAASILYTGRLESASPVMGRNILLDLIGATVIGGTSLYGGKGKILWTVYGVLFLALIDNSLNLLNLSYFTIMMAKGAVIVMAATIDSVRNKLLNS